MRLVVDRKALADIDNIYRWISYDSPAVAARIVRRLFSSIEHLATFPNLGHSGLDPGTLEWNVPKTPYQVVYELRSSSDELLVLAVFHQAQHRLPNSE